MRRYIVHSEHTWSVSSNQMYSSSRFFFFTFSKISPRTPLSQFYTFLQKDYWVCLPRNPSSPPHNSFFSHVRFSSLPKTSPAKNSPTRLSPINFSNPFFASYLFYFSFFFYPSLSFPYKLLPTPLLLVQRRRHPQSPPWQNGDVCHTSMQLAPFGNRLLPLQKIKIKTQLLLGCSSKVAGKSKIKRGVYNIIN